MRPRDHLVVALTALLAAGSATYTLAKPAPPFDDAVRTPVASASPADPFRSGVERKPVDDAFIAPRPEWSRVPIPDTPAGDALKALLDAFNAGDSERLAVLLGAFTPQELAFDVPRSSRGLDIVAIVGSAPLEIEYVAEDRTGGARRHGRLEVHAWDTRRIARLEIRARSDADLP